MGVVNTYYAADYKNRNNENTGKVYRKVAIGLYRSNGMAHNHAHREAFRKNFSEIEADTNAVSEEITKAIEIINDNCVNFFGPGRSVDIKTFTGWCLHGTRPDQSLAFSKLKEALKKSGDEIKSFIINDTLVEVFDEIYYVEDWSTVKFTEMEAVFPIVKPIFAEFGISAEEFNRILPKVEWVYNHIQEMTAQPASA